jgi:hypothetical protein
VFADNVKRRKLYREKVLNTIQENFDKRDKIKAQITFPLRHFFPLKVVK